MNNENKKVKNRKALRVGAYSFTLSAVALAIVVIINVIMASLPSKYTKLDLSEEQIYTIGDTTKKLLSELENDVTIYIICESGKEDRNVFDLVENYKGESSHIKVKTVDPALEPSFVSKYTSDQLSSNSMIVESEKRNTVVYADSLYMYYISDLGYAVSPSEYQQIMYQYYYTYGTTLNASPMYYGEQAITSSIDYVVTDDIPVMYYTSGHGEASLGSSFQTTISDENIEYKSINLDSASSIPEDAAAVLIFSPASDITDTEKSVLEDYLKKGGDIVLVTDFSKYNREEFKNLSSVADKMGLTSVDGIIVETDTSYYSNYVNYLIPKLGDASSAPMSFMANTNYYVYMLNAHGIKASENTEAKITPILTTSEKAIAKTSGNTSSASLEEGDTEGQFYTGVMSSLSDSESGKTGRLIWYSSPSIADGSTSGRGNTALFAASANTVCGKTTSISIIGKNVGVENLEVTEAQSLNWSIILVGFIPLAFVACGLTVWIRRRRR